MDHELSPDGGTRVRFSLESVRLDGRGPRPHGGGGIRGGRLAGSAQGAGGQPARVLRAGHRRARPGLLHVGPGGSSEPGYGVGPLRALLGAERRDLVGDPARLHG